jgi:hypothetical protein
MVAEERKHDAVHGWQRKTTLTYAIIVFDRLIVKHNCSLDLLKAS